MNYAEFIVLALSIFALSLIMVFVSVMAIYHWLRAMISTSIVQRVKVRHYERRSD